MNVLSKLTKRHLKLNKKRTIVSIIGIALSTALIFAVSISVLSFRDLAMRAAIDSSGNFEAKFADVQLANTKYIEDNSNTKEVMYSKTLGISKLNVDAKASKQYIEVTAYDGKAFENYPCALKEGTLPKDSSEIVISENINPKTGLNYKVGDKLTLNIGTRDNAQDTTLSNVTKKIYTITGILKADYTERSYSDTFSAFTYLDKSGLNTTDTVTVGVTFKNLAAMKTSVNEMSTGANAKNIAYNNTLLTWSGYSSHDNANTFLYAIAAVVIALIIIGSVAVIYNAFAISVNERKKQFGILASVGATSKQIKKMVFQESAIMGAIGIPLGLVIGYLGMFVTFSLINGFYFFGESFNMQNANFNVIISPIILTITLVILIVTILISAYIPAKRAAKVTPLEAIRLTNDIKMSRKKLRTSRLTQKLFGIEGIIALKNLKRNRKRYRTTIFSLFISIVLFISFSTIILYAFDLSDQQLGTSDYDFAFSVGGNGLSEADQLDVINKAVKLEGAGEYWIYRSVDAEATTGLSNDYKAKFKKSASSTNTDISLNVSIVEMQDEAFANYAKEVGVDTNAFSKGGISGILVNKMINGNSFIKPVDLTANSDLNLEIISDKQTNNIKLQLAAVTDKAPVAYGYSREQVYVIVPKSSMKNLLAVDNKIDISGYMGYLKATDSATYAAKIEDLKKANTVGTLYYTDVKAMIKSMQAIKLFMSIFLYGFIVIITLIGVTNVFNTINTNIQLRRKEFAMLKSVGLTPKGFNKMLYYESIFYGLKALLYGLPVGIGLSYLMYYIFGGVGVFSFVLPWNSIIICIVAVFFIVYMTMLYAGSKIKKENIMDALVSDII